MNDDRRFPVVRFVGYVLTAAALVFVPAAAAKDFKPGDLRACNTRTCVPIADQKVLNALSTLYYGSQPLRTAVAPRLGAPYFELRFRNGYATGIAAGVRLDRFLSYGVNLDRLRRGSWYHVSDQVARELETLTASLRPYRLTRAAIEKSR